MIFRTECCAEATTSRFSQRSWLKRGGNRSTAKAAPIVRRTILESRGTDGLFRLTRRIYLPLEDGRQSLRGEIFGILTKDRNGAPIDVLIKKGDVAWSRAPSVTTSVATKIKTSVTSPSRLCSRGDCIPSIDQPFAPAPTVSRDSHDIFPALFETAQHSHWAQVDIPNASTQSDLLRERDGVVSSAPDFVGADSLKCERRIPPTRKAGMFD